jgi:tagatose 1,6-diphosphate aldolase
MLPAMTTLTLGSTWTAARARAVDQIAGDDGVVVGAAVDHRDSLSVALRRRGLPDPRPEELTALKVRVARELAPKASVILLDAEFSAAQALAAGAIPRSTGLVVPLEAQGYGDVADIRRTSFLPGWDPQKAAALGACGCKLLLPYRPDVPEQSRRQDAVVEQAIAACRQAGVALVLEPIVYQREGEDLLPERFSELVIETAQRLSAFGPEILKLQYPGSAAACVDLDRACGPDVPWVLLGGGADADALIGQIDEACSAGASGFIVGRTLFDPGLVAAADASVRALREESVPMFARMAAAARRHARPWRERVGAIPAPPLGWYRS